MDAAKDRERINPFRLFVGSFVPNWLLQRRELSPGAKLAFARLAQFAGKRGVAYPKQSTLARELGISVRQLRRHLGALVRCGLIQAQRPARTRTTRYTFHDHVWITGRERTHVAAREGTHVAARTPVPSKDRARAALKRINRRESPRGAAGGASPLHPRSQSDREPNRHPIPAPARETLAKLGLLEFGKGKP